MTCSPLMLIRWATPVSRNSSQSSRSIAAWSPTASAASTPAAWASATRSRIASRTAWRARSAAWPASSASRRLSAPAAARTVPLARMPCSNNHSSRSKPCGLSEPCGWRKRALSDQRWPARSCGGGAASSWSPSVPRYQPSMTRSGTSAVRPSPGAGSARSTRKTKRAPCGPSCGMRAMTPTSRRSCPSNAAGSACARRRSARQPVLPKPSSASASSAQASAATGRARRITAQPAPATSAATSSSR